MGACSALIAGEAGIFPGVVFATPPGNQQAPVWQNCRDERELMTCLNVFLGGGEMQKCCSRRAREESTKKSFLSHCFVAHLPIFCKNCHFLKMENRRYVKRLSGNSYVVVPGS